MPPTTQQFPLFGAKVEMTLINAEEEFASQAMQEAYDLGVELSRIFNIYDPSSEISQLNKRRKLNVSNELLQLLKIALDFCRKSNGAYDVTFGKNFLERKSGSELSNLACSYEDVLIIGNTVELKHPDALIDLGSIAKGYIASRMAKELQEFGAENGYVDARGDLQFFGEPITIGVQHPRKDSLICKIIVSNKGVATSGDYKQFHGSFDKSHILGKNDVISATVVADDAAIADIYATMLMVCNDDAIEGLMRDADSSVKAMVIDNDLNIRYYNGFEELIL